MKKLNKKGFTLIELLAVITIMGILMLVAIPAVSRTIENSRRSTFANTAKSYINAVKNAVAADEFDYAVSGTEKKPISAAPTGYYYYSFTSSDPSGTDLMEQGGKSSWGGVHVSGYVAVHKTVTAASGTERGRTTYEYAITMVDSAGRGIGKLTLENDITRSKVMTSGQATITVPNGGDNNKFDSTALTSSNTKQLSLNS